MQMTPPDPRQLIQAGLEALRAGDPRRARALFEQTVAAGRGDSMVHTALAFACKALGDGAAALAALDRAIALDPRNFRALVMKGDHLAAAGDDRAASGFYLTAAKVAPPIDKLPPDAANDLRRAQAANERYARQFEAALLETLREAGFGPDRTSPRFARSLDILFGKKPVYVQEPKTYYFPGLPNIQFYERADFPWLDRVEAATDAIAEEVRAVLADPDAFPPYVTVEEGKPLFDEHGMAGNPDWGAFFLWKYGTEMVENTARCPRTVEALEGVPLTRLPNRAPSILFSLLRPGARIPPHNGLINTRLICHLPVIVPPGCALRVGDETREWVKGRAVLFDDTIEHEAWNGSDELRVVLLFDVARPELSAEEQAMVAAMFGAIDAYTGQKVEWEV